MRIGMGYDSHRFEGGRPLVLGGVTIPHDRGLKGHSDGDALVHAICDALLGAAGMEDIGTLFPPGDPATEGIDSLKLLSRVIQRVEAQWFNIVNVDAVVIAEKPAMGPHFPAMRKALCGVMHLDGDLLGLKAKTNEGMGFVGREEGIAVYAVALLTSDSKRKNR